MKKNRFFKNDGMTLIEIVMAMAIGSILIGGIAQLNVMVTRSANSQYASLSSHADRIVTSTVLRQDLMSASSSMNALSQADDAGYNFFDFDPDYECDCGNPNDVSSLTAGDAARYPLAPSGGSVPEGCTRSLTLYAASAGALSNATSSTTLITSFDGSIVAVGSKKLVLIESVGALLMYSPASAYDSSSHFVGLNQAGAMTSSAAFANAWGPPLNNILLFTGPASLLPPMPNPAPPSQATQTGMPKRPSYFLGVVTDTSGSGQVTPAGTTFGDSTFQNGYPGVVSTSPVTLSTLDTYFRYLPPLGGAKTFSYVQQVRLVQYDVRQKTVSLGNEKQTVNQLYRSYWNPTQSAFGAATVVGEGFNFLQFKRPCISTPVIQYVLQ
jgi:prepilin-type N-terminal cleavage/methylation domain-containing protein